MRRIEKRGLKISRCQVSGLRRAEAATSAQAGAGECVTIGEIKFISTSLKFYLLTPESACGGTPDTFFLQLTTFYLNLAGTLN